MDFIGLFFPIILIAPYVIFVLSLYSFIKYLRLYIKHGEKEDLKECEQNFWFILISIFMSLIFFI